MFFPIPDALQFCRFRLQTLCARNFDWVAIYQSSQDARRGKFIEACSARELSSRCTAENFVGSEKKQRRISLTLGVALMAWTLIFAAISLNPYSKPCGACPHCQCRFLLTVIACEISDILGIASALSGRYGYCLARELDLLFRAIVAM